MVNYAPIISDYIPSFLMPDSDLFIEIKVPYKNNPLVNPNEKNIILRIKDYISSQVIQDPNAPDFPEARIEGGMAIFGLGAFSYTLKDKEYNFPSTDMFYKIQIAYDDGSANHVWSDAAVCHCITRPSISITQNQGVCQGIIKTASNEAIVSYSYELYKNDKLIQETEEIFYNNEIKPFKIKQDLIFGEKYNAKFNITTAGGYQQSAETGTFTPSALIPSQYKISLAAENNYEEGYIQLSLVAPSAIGKFVIEKKVNDNEWETVSDFTIDPELEGLTYYWKDYYIEQGKIYTYRLRQYKDNIYSKPISIVSVYADYEDMFLYDGEKQLKIRFNPQVSNFKTTLQESKVETLGNKYPYFFKNPVIEYKEFSINGLISCLIDENKNFDDEHLLIDTSLTGKNIYEERKFKLKVLNWLNDGKEKIFKSPTEGMYKVRLQGVSLSPEDTLGRMLHSFSCSAYECGEIETQPLEKKEPIGDYITKVITVKDLSASGDTSYTTVRNIVWVQNEFSTEATITLDGQSFANTSGLFKTPTNQTYGILTLTEGLKKAPSFQVSFEQLRAGYNESSDDFGKGTFTTYWKISNSDDETLKYSDDMLSINYLTFSRTSDTDSYITIDGQSVIYLTEDNQNRQYADITFNTIECNNATYVMNYTKKEETT